MQVFQKRTRDCGRVVKWRGVVCGLIVLGQAEGRYRVQSQAQNHMHASFLDALSDSTGLIPTQAIFGGNIACLYLGDAGQKLGF